MLKINKYLTDQLKTLHSNDDDFKELDSLRIEVYNILNKRKEKFLNSKELENIICWKLANQANRSKSQRQINTDDIVIPITKAYFNLKTNNFEYETEIKIKLLTSLKGVGTPLATAVMAITEPRKYCIIDSVLWAYIFKEEKSSFTTTNYLKFRSFIAELSSKINEDIQRTEFSLWKHSMKFRE